MQVKLSAPYAVQGQWTLIAGALRAQWGRVVSWFVMEAPEEWAMHPDVLAHLSDHCDIGQYDVH